ncbi:hypothetical protein LJ737_04135 [Hymenobacter sp. 15J16-1T3B]|uniref:hypothetical protein n=1 Tax=Hymenobacter sp. 15J16-1T3B TaxID=2886941 RepID=UPI001D0F4FF8|nr:hypothetical protein [Hymenobacter sp. 15J16-1T3B]MCC3156411.1 hypothetical protein [Hymenobacter sp. 15J16-1T3B]
MRFQRRQWFIVNGKPAAALPTGVVVPPAGVHELKWLLREPYQHYGVDARKRLWHLPHADAAGRNRPWRQIHFVVKNGYDVFTLRKDGRAVQLSRRQLLKLAYRNPAWAGECGSAPATGQVLPPPLQSTS